MPTPHYHAEHRTSPVTTIVVHRESPGGLTTLELAGPIPLAELDEIDVRAVVRMLTDAGRPACRRFG